MNRDIRLNVETQPTPVDKPYANMLGPIYKSKAMYKGSEVEIILTPFANIGQWFRPGENKPQKWSSNFTYGVWLYDKDMK